MKKFLMVCLVLAISASLFASVPAAKNTHMSPVLTKGGAQMLRAVGPVARPSLPAVGSRDPNTLDDVIISEDFESVAPGSLPQGWTQVDVDQGSTVDPACPGLSVWQVYDQQGFPAHSGTRIVANHYNDNALPNNDWLILPQQNLTGTITFSFWAATHQATYPESFEVKVSTTGAQPADFTHLLGSVPNVPAEYTQYTYDLSAYAGAPFYVAIHYNSIDEFVFKVDDVLLEAGTPGVVAGVVTDAETTDPLGGAVVSVSGGGSDTTDAAGHYSISASEGTHILSFAHDGYTTLVDSNVTIVANDTITLDIALTPRHVQTIISEDFESVAPGSLPQGWTQVDVDQGSTVDPACPGLSVWQVYDQQGFPAHSGTRIVANHYNDNALPNNDWLILPQQNLTGTITFSFWAATHQATYPESFEVKVSTTGAQPADFTHLLGSVPSVPAVYTQYTYDLSAYAGAPFYVAIHYNSIDEFVFKVDDVLLEAGGQNDQAVGDHASAVQSFSFEGNYPNPFNSQTEFRFALPNAGLVQLTLYNVVGQEVARVYNGNLTAGDHTVPFNAAGLPSGIYFARLTAAGMSATHKMMLLK